MDIPIFNKKTVLPKRFLAISPPKKIRIYKQKRQQKGLQKYGDWKTPEDRDNFLARKCSIVMRRNADKIKATPKWANSEKIVNYYKLAKQMTKLTGINHEVDHIIPLRNQLVCGLHWEGNLQVITKEENLKKRAHFDQDDHRFAKTERIVNTN